MQQIFKMVQQVTSVMLVFSLLFHIFSDSSYRRYFQFVEGLLILLLLITPLVQYTKKQDFMENCFKVHQSEWQRQELEDEMEMIGKKREEWIKNQSREESREERQEGESEGRLEK
ncbi:MAG: stage III sporulation protein AF [Eubacterium sp.]|nr:stage III sporulation protein AF [Eubacterium sp.]